MEVYSLVVTMQNPTPDKVKQIREVMDTELAAITLRLAPILNSKGMNLKRSATFEIVEK